MPEGGRRTKLEEEDEIMNPGRPEGRISCENLEYSNRMSNTTPLRLKY